MRLFTHHRLTHPLPSKQLPAAQPQTRTRWLSAGAQPQAPTAQVSGKSPVLAQHEADATVPPDMRQPCSAELGEQPFSATFTAWMTKATLTSAPLGMPCGQADAWALPKAMFTSVISSSMVALPVPSQSPTPP